MALCPECGETELTGRQKVCGNRCRARKRRRIDRGRAEGTGPAQNVELPQGAVAEAVADTVRQAVTPIVREALTDDVLVSIAELVKLTPKAIKAIEQDLDSENDFIRQGAYRLLARYTLGHPALVPELESDRQVVVLVDGIARPQGPPQPSEQLAVPGPLETVEGEFVETRVCDTCDKEKPVGEFVGASHRCESCFTLARDHAHSIGVKP